MGKNNKVVVISFADSKYKTSLERLKKEVEEFKSITKSYFFTEKDLDAEFKKSFHPFIYRRGYGYWKWKAYLAKKVLDTLEINDILIWSDAGTIFNARFEEKLKEYLNLTIESPSGILAFQDKYIEKQCNKADCLQYFNVLNNKDITDTAQFLGGCWMIRKTADSVDFINRWYEAIMDNFDLISDKQSKLPNFKEFIEHRHDQSVFSILVKQYDIEFIPCEDLDLPSSPIQTKRNKQKSLIDNIRLKLLLPLRYIIGLYLKYVKKFYFKDRVAW